MTSTIRVREHVTRVTPLGLRFWDEVSGSVIGEGLSVAAYSSQNPERRVRALTNHAGVYLLQNLPGLHEAETGAGDEAYWANLPAPKKFVIEVTDNDQRFQPFLFTAELPARSFFTLSCLPAASPPASPPEASTVVPLYSAPTRAVPGAMAVLRAELYDSVNQKPAAWAVLEARLNGLPPVTGFADDQGRIALIFPYPEPIQPSSSGSPPANRRPLVEQQWVVQLRALYAPSLASAEIPDLCEVFAQPPATLLSELSPPTPLSEATLEFGKALVVKSQSQSLLFLTPF
jgi:hypothetical protein